MDKNMENAEDISLATCSESDRKLTFLYTRNFGMSGSGTRPTTVNLIMVDGSDRFM